MSDRPLPSWPIDVPGDWTDYNDHLNEGYFAVAFSQATDAALDQLGIGEQYHARTGRSLFTVETHIRYLAQARAGDRLNLTSVVIGADSKRLRFWHDMHVAETLRATQEVMLIHVDGHTGRATQFPARVTQLLRAHITPPPAAAGSAIQNI